MRWLTVVALSAVCAACSTPEGSLQIYGSIPVDKSDCTLDPATEIYLDAGIYDPRGVFSVPMAYAFKFIIYNTLSAPSEGTTAASGGENANDAEVVAMDVCWFPAHPGSDGETAYEAYKDGVPENLRCDNLPDNQKTTTVLAVPVDAGGKTPGSVGILGTTALQSLYGAGFEPWNIPDEGAFPYGSRWIYSLWAADPTDLGSRHPAWGDFPPSWSARIIVQARANAILLSGGTIQSNWFVFPVDVCVGCSRPACGLPYYEECVAGDRCPLGDPQGDPCPPGGLCSDGSYCIGSDCPDGSPCPVPRCPSGSVCSPGGWELIGSIPSTQDTCLTSQDYGPTCETQSACPE